MFFLSAFAFINIYTKHGQAISVPDLYGLTNDEIDIILKEKRLRYHILDSIYLVNKERGTVIDQYPAPNYKVKKNRTIYITINAFTPEKVEMPNVIGVSLRQAKAIIENCGLSVGKISYIPDIAINNVLKQKLNGKEIPEGTEVIKGTPINLVLGNGLSNIKTDVPNLVGLSLKYANNRTQEAFLNIGLALYDNTVQNKFDTANAIIYKQKPLYNTPINRGASIDIWLTVDENKVNINEFLSD